MHNLFISQVRTSDGQQKYGRNFRDVSYFAEMHNALSGDKECDHLHDGLGFFTRYDHLHLFKECTGTKDTVSVPRTGL